MIVIDCPQCSDEWFLARLGKPTSSHFNEIVTSKGEPSKQAIKYMHRLAGEKITGVPVETYQNAIMQRGTELEPEARNLFELVHGIEVQQVGLVYRDEQQMYSCSPDGLMEGSGLEIKCPLLHTHVSYLLDGKLPTEYIQQVQGSMFVTGFATWWFMSYFPGLPPLILEVKKDETFIFKLEKSLDKFCLDLAVTINKLKELS